MGKSTVALEKRQESTTGSRNGAAPIESGGGFVGCPAGDDCRWRYAAPAFHDELLTIDDDTLGVVLKLMQGLDWAPEDNDIDDRPPTVPPFEWSKFAGDHNWRDPVRVTMLLSELCLAHRRCAKAEKMAAATEAIGMLVRWADRSGWPGTDLVAKFRRDFALHGGVR